ncbi:MAG: hypothetical protein GY940_27360, partial [bacterium]|nr:hypothetical protein [bacterium]
MKIDEEVAEAQQKLSKVNTQFREFAQKNPDALNISSFKSLDINFEGIVLQAWPTFVNRETTSQFREVSVKLFELVRQLPRRVFGDDIKKISSYYGITEILASSQMEGMTDNHLRSLVARGDFLISSTGLIKCLEYNVTANLGGWYVPIWETLYLNTPIIAKFLKEYQVKLNRKNLILGTLETIARSAIGKMSPRENEANIAMVRRNIHLSPNKKKESESYLE